MFPNLLKIRQVECLKPLRIMSWGSGNELNVREIRINFIEVQPDPRQNI